jgi:hypothetical protein
VTQSIAPKTGVNAVLTPEESVLILIDHQPLQSANVPRADDDREQRRRPRQGGEGLTSRSMARRRTPKPRRTGRSSGGSERNSSKGAEAARATGGADLHARKSGIRSARPMDNISIDGGYRHV